MPKPITLEMLHAMTPDQRKTLHRNASSRDTPAAHEILQLLSQDDLMARPKPVAAAPRKTAPRKTASAKTASAKTADARKPVKAVHGRQA